MSRKVFDTMRKRFYVCSCGQDLIEIRWGKDNLPLCPKEGCGLEMHEDYGQFGLAPGIITDDIPGGLEVRHAICNPDGTPKKYYSKSEIRKAAHEAGYTISGETPKPNSRLNDQKWQEAVKKGRNWI